MIRFVLVLNFAGDLAAQFLRTVWSVSRALPAFARSARKYRLKQKWERELRERERAAPSDQSGA